MLYNRSHRQSVGISGNVEEVWRMVDVSLDHI